MSQEIINGYLQQIFLFTISYILPLLWIGAFSFCFYAAWVERQKEPPFRDVSFWLKSGFYILGVGLVTWGMWWYMCLPKVLPR